MPQPRRQRYFELYGQYKVIFENTGEAAALPGTVWETSHLELPGAPTLTKTQ